MKQFENTFEFVVSKRQVGKNKELRLSNLYKKVEVFANEAMMRYNGMYKTHQTSYDFTIVNNAFLNDELIIKSSINQLDENFFELKVLVIKKNKKVVCNATFGYAIKKAS